MHFIFIKLEKCDMIESEIIPEEKRVHLARFVVKFIANHYIVTI